MANVNITSSECAWANFEVKILGRTIKGLRGFGFKKTIDKEHLYGAGDEPLDIMGGNKKYEGNIKLLGFEVDKMNEAAQTAGYEDITEVPHELIVITCSYKKRAIDPVWTYTATGVAFTETGVDLEQNAKHREITLPYIAMNQSHRKRM
ncbi:hypothetical protein FO675_06240 [Riemerella anatipestifer]|uniref:hypothetical protein n=1 Tax=Riemerella anatipestifer TaxID=34085 RepID=UPI001AD79CAC|nr:hypothetical protein [Riemerella anatipestifer]MBO4233902.1 hypothetical protein [Riemerella anatipestifer]